MVVVPPGAIASLVQISSLQKLDLEIQDMMSREILNDQILAELAMLTQLTSLGFTIRGIDEVESDTEEETKYSAIQLATLTNLKQLQLYAHVFMSDVGRMSSLTALTQLDMFNTGVPPRDIPHLASALRCMPDLREVTLPVYHGPSLELLLDALGGTQAGEDRAGARAVGQHLGAVQAGAGVVQGGGAGAQGAGQGVRPGLRVFQVPGLRIDRTQPLQRYPQVLHSLEELVLWDVIALLEDVHWFMTRVSPGLKKVKVGCIVVDVSPQQGGDNPEHVAAQAGMLRDIMELVARGVEITRHEKEANERILSVPRSLPLPPPIHIFTGRRRQEFMREPDWDETPEAMALVRALQPLQHLAKPSLDLRGSGKGLHLTADLAAELASAVPNLHTLELYSADDAALASLSQLTGLQDLTLLSPCVDAITFPELEKLSHLTRLAIGLNGSSMSVTAPVSDRRSEQPCFPNLKMLGLFGGRPPMHLGRLHYLLHAAPNLKTIFGSRLCIWLPDGMGPNYKLSSKIGKKAMRQVQAQVEDKAAEQLRYVASRLAQLDNCPSDLSLVSAFGMSEEAAVPKLIEALQPLAGSSDVVGLEVTDIPCMTHKAMSALASTLPGLREVSLTGCGFGEGATGAKQSGKGGAKGAAGRKGKAGGSAGGAGGDDGGSSQHPLMQLAKMKQLNMLKLRMCEPLAPQDVATFHKARPQVDILCR